jgi:hypothetical protein
MKNSPTLLCTLLVAAALSLLSCDLLVGPDPENSPQNNFDILWHEFDHYYSFFVYKGINWDSLYAVYRPQVNNTTGDGQLFAVMSSLLSNLKDGHVNLYARTSTFSYTDWYTRYPRNLNFNDVKQNYLKNQFRVTSGGTFLYGKVADSVGYIYIGSFGGGNYQAIDDILAEYQGLKALIIDVRFNGGGNSNNADLVAQRFFDQRRLVSYIQWRNGPKHSDFTDFIPIYLDPDGPVRFTKPVAVLTNRLCFSSTESFILSMMTLPNVSLVGDTTGGGSGNPLFRELPNGWTYRIPRWIEYTADRKPYEGIGIPPKYPVWISKADSLAGRDTILDTALQLLSK